MFMYIQPLPINAMCRDSRTWAWRLRMAFPTVLDSASAPGNCCIFYGVICAMFSLVTSINACVI